MGGVVVGVRGAVLDDPRPPAARLGERDVVLASPVPDQIALGSDLLELRVANVGVTRPTMGADVDVAAVRVAADQKVAVALELQIVAVDRASAGRVQVADQAPVEPVDLVAAGLSVRVEPEDVAAR